MLLVLNFPMNINIKSFQKFPLPWFSSIICRIVELAVPVPVGLGRAWELCSKLALQVIPKRVEMQSRIAGI